jgi:hypothetical protein
MELNTSLNSRVAAAQFCRLGIAEFSEGVDLICYCDAASPWFRQTDGI